MESHVHFLLTSKMLKHSFKEVHLTFQRQNLLFLSILKLVVQLLDILSLILQLMQVLKLTFLSKWKQSLQISQLLFALNKLQMVEQHGLEQIQHKLFRLNTYKIFGHI